MIHLIRRLLSEPLPSEIHFHVDQHGDEVWCDEQVCRPQPQPHPIALTPFR